MNAQTLRDYGALAVSVLIVGALFLALMIAWKSGDNTSLSIIIGGIMTQFANVVGYYIGSSVGSAKKDEVLTKLAQTNNPAPTP